MRLANYQVTLFVAATLLLIGLGFASGAQNDEAGNLVDQPTTLPSARARFQLPKLFDFSKFTSLFGKHYHSVMESLVRKKIYLARAFSAFISVVSYKHEKSTSYLSVNAQSDRTPEELERLKISADKMRLTFNRSRQQPKPPQPETSEKPAQEKAAAEPLPVADLDEIERELEELSELKGDAGAKAIVEELKAGRRARRGAGRRSQLSADELMRSPVAKETSNKIRRRIPSNNPNYQPVELESQAAAGDGEEKEKPMDSSVMSLFSRVSSVPYIKSVVGWASEKFRAATGSEQQEDEAPKQKSVAKSVSGGDAQDKFIDYSPTSGAGQAVADRVFVDHRDSNCFFEPRQQGQCGSCYSFATVSLFEYLFCRDTRKLVAFSEQYLVDCGSRIQDMNGCEGAPLDTAVSFVERMGLELRNQYPYRAENGTCPYDNNVPFKAMGYVHVRNKGFVDVPKTELDERLKTAPLLVALSHNTEFLFYGGGVDELRGCSNDMNHAMLMVGHGREDGMEYYLLRNSFSVAWGEQGYYKVSKRALWKCITDEVALESMATFKKSAARAIPQ